MAKKETRKEVNENGKLERERERERFVAIYLNASEAWVFGCHP